MTDKQIIIDGVDVSGCYYYSEGKCLGCYALNEKDCISCYGICKDINDCHYKQLKRKEQECDVLRKLAETHLAETINMQRELDQLTEELAISIQENEEGREINAELKAENEHLSEKEEEAKHYLEEASKYKQALTEIKKIAETCNSGVSCSACPYTKECRTDLEAEALGVCKMVLKKCEVLDDICTNKEYGI